MPTKKVLVTGAAGFLGLHVMDALLERGHRIRALDNFLCSRPEAIERYRGRIDFIKGDIRRLKDVRKAMAGVDVVFHLAAIRSVAKTVEDPFVAHEINATGTLLLLREASAAGVKHFIFTSTSAVYGDTLGRFQKEEGPFKPISPYGVAKLAAEHYARYYFLEKKLPTSCVRIFNVYGPRQNPESRYSLVVPGVLSKIFSGQRPVIDGSGKQARDFVYVEDVVRALLMIWGDPKAYGKVYNLGCGKATSVTTLVERLLKLSGSSLKPVHGPRRPGDPERTCAAVALIRKELGWKPRVSLDEGLTKVVSWAQKEKKAF
ncbi:MAG: NAD-dependent epimerase/dehydratase family protein [Candidatus Omnitrophica bacterium]|nr:NAD-dependent epimerase/dehydratase family protein [Candidatus Omnitrophota bacterium]